MGEISTFLGCEITIKRDIKALYITQNKYTQEILNKYNKRDTKGYDTPYESGVKLRSSTTQASQEEIKDYQRQIGALLYLSLKTRPDIAFSVAKCSRYMSNPNSTHFKALNRIWCYLNKYPNLGLKYDCNIDPTLKIYSDSDWASSLEDRKSTEAYITLLGNSPINWKVKKQATVALSSTEAEYMALKTATTEAIYIARVLTYITNSISIKLVNSIPTILVDNQGARDLSANSQHHERTKHIDISYHFLRDEVEKGTINIVHIPDPLQIADPLTKGVLKSKLDWFKSEIGLV